MIGPGKSHWLYAGGILVLGAVLLASCIPQPKVNENKVHLVFTTFLEEEVFNSQIKQPVEAKYPEIELNYNWESAMIITLGLDNSESLGDIRHVKVRSGPADVDYIPEAKLPNAFTAEDLRPYVENSQLDTSRIDRKIWNHAESIQTHGELAVLPYSKKLFALYYNKQVFDKYGVDYPRDGMTWNDVLALARQLPPGVKLDPSSMGWINLAYQLGIDWEDLSSNHQETREKWMEIISLYEKLASLPGYKYWEVWHSDNEFLDGFKQNEVAMSISPYWYFSSRIDSKIRSLPLQRAIQAGIDMDVVTFPFFADHPDQQPARMEEALQMYASSTHKEEAFQVMAYLLSDEHQLSISKLGVGPVLENPDIKQAFASAIPEVQDRNLMAFFPPSHIGNLNKGHLLESRKVLNMINTIDMVFQEILKHKLDAETAIEQIMSNY